CARNAGTNPKNAIAARARMCTFAFCIAVIISVRQAFRIRDATLRAATPERCRLYLVMTMRRFCLRSTLFLAAVASLGAQVQFNSTDMTISVGGQPFATFNR